ncbi:MAG: thiolase family protein [Firmicutes bacterium]|nr:thiolase family protein [Bacillota bacterium]
MRDVYVLGVGQTFFGKQPLLTAADLGAQAANLAIKDCGISPKDLQRAYCGSVYSQPTIAQAILVRVGVNSIPAYTVENACASGSSAVDLLYRDIAMCGCEVGMAIGVESMSAFSRKIGGKGLLTTEGDIHGEQGMSTVSYFAGIANLLMSESGATLEDLAYAAVKNHINGSKNTLAKYRKIFTTEDILNSAMIVNPITAYMCCPQSDGAAAIILCSKEYYEKHKKDSRPPVKIAASVIASGGAEDAGYNQLEMKNLINGCKQAYEMAGIGPEDLNVIELHDAFSNEELAAYEMMGICPKGEGVAFARSGAAEIGGRIPVNPSGGLLSMGHPLGASGVRVVNDIAKQLWGEAGDNQVEGANVGMAEMLGGLLSTIETSPIAGLQILTK